jgi:hypothetical protein
MIAGSERKYSEAGSSFAARGVDHRHRILDRHRLRAGRLGVALRATEDGQDDRLLADQQVRAVQLGV